MAAFLSRSLFCFVSLMEARNALLLLQRTHTEGFLLLLGLFLYDLKMFSPEI